jgi:AraC-like DNA-binding protein
MLPAISLVGFLSAFILLHFTDRVNVANRYLAYHFILNSLFSFSHWSSIVTDNETLRAISAIHYFPFYLLNTPFLYFYVRAILTEKKIIRGWDYLHFIPFFIIVLNILPYTFHSWAFKLDLAEKIHHNSRIIYQVYFPLVPFSFYFISRSVVSFCYMVFAAAILFRSIQEGKLKSAAVLRKWLQVYLILGLIFNISLIALSTHSYFANDFMIVLDEQGRGRSVASIIMFGLMVSIYFFPSVLYGLEGKSGASLLAVVKLNEEIATNVKTFELSKIRIKRVEKQLNEYVLEKKFLVPGFAMSDLVKDLATPEHVLTYYFNNYKGITFLKWKNQLRIEEAVMLLKAGKAETNTLESVGKACGYKSRSNFIQTFKAQTGESPSVYLKKLS